MPINDAGDLANALTDVTADLGDTIEELEGGAERLNRLREGMGAIAAYMSHIEDLERDAAGHDAALTDAQTEIEELRDALEVIAERGIVHELYCKFYITGGCGCLPPAVAKLMGY